MKKLSKILMLLVVIACSFAICAYAETVDTFSIETVNSSKGVYKIVSTVESENGIFAGTNTTITFDNSVFVPVNSSTYEAVTITDGAIIAEPVKVTSGVNHTSTSPLWNVSGTTVTLNVQTYLAGSTINMTNGVMAFEMYFKYATGKTIEDVTAASFGVSYVKVLNDYDNTEYTFIKGAETNTVTINNTVADVITIPVTAGDIIYLQDGTTKTATSTGDYEVSATVGYVAVNTAKTSQSTYYVDGSKATLVHTNAVVTSDDISLRDRTDVFQGNENLGDRNGMRFKMAHNAEARDLDPHGITELGFVMTAESNKVITGNSKGENYVLDMDMVTEGFAVKGEAWNSTMAGSGRVFDSSLDDAWIIRAVMYNIPIDETGVQTVIVSRPYYKVGNQYIYGETTESTLYAEAVSIKNDQDAWDSCTDSMKTYIEEIIRYVESSTPVVEDEIIIDISGLYSAL